MNNIISGNTGYCGYTFYDDKVTSYLGNKSQKSPVNTFLLSAMTSVDDSSTLNLNLNNIKLEKKFFYENFFFNLKSAGLTIFNNHSNWVLANKLLYTFDTTSDSSFFTNTLGSPSSSNNVVKQLKSPISYNVSELVYSNKIGIPLTLPIDFQKKADIFEEICLDKLLVDKDISTYSTFYINIYKNLDASIWQELDFFEDLI